jgi:DNA-binding response OmpR family regulator
MTEQRRILIVEDNKLIAMDLADELSDRGFDPVCATTIPDARKLFEQQAPSFAVLDMHLKADTSFDLARELKGRAIPFVFVSGNDASSLPEDLRSAKMLTKPIDFDELGKTISDMGKKA